MTSVWIWLASLAWADDIEGKYWNPDRTRQIEVTIEQGVLCGTVVWVKTPEQNDQLGTEIIRECVLAGSEASERTERGVSLRTPTSRSTTGRRRGTSVAPGSAGRGVPWSPRSTGASTRV
ncbi:MAG: hypothetical protein AAF211_12325 [Myxococcota bacterium]